MPVTLLRNGRALHWSEGGDPVGTPVVFFHGCPDTRRAAWSGHGAAREAGIRLIAAAREALLVPHGYLADAALVFENWSFRVEDVRCPVTLWYGEHDVNAPPRNGAWLADRLPRATRHVLPGAGHLESLVGNWGPVLRSALPSR
jgi:pimeloyl-ACP methyl ester carboxylesterase